MWYEVVVTHFEVLLKKVWGGTDKKHEESKLRQPSFGPRIERGTSEMPNAIYEYSTAKFDRDLLGLPRTDIVDISRFSVARNCRFRYEMA
jgi:hypothetical protein